MDPQAHSLYSSYRERLIEHMFIGALLQEMWLLGEYQVEVLKSEVDGAGYDLVLEARSIVRHVQLKSAFTGSSTALVNIQKKLGEKPSGCVLWILFNPKDLRLGPYRWFGGDPGEPLPNMDSLKVARHTKGNKDGLKGERVALRVVPKARFRELKTMKEVIGHLFGRQFTEGDTPLSSSEITDFGQANP